MHETIQFNILADDLSAINTPSPAFVTFGETMIRETPADLERAERTRKVYLSLSGSEHILCIGLSRLGIFCRYITRVPDNPYGWMLRNVSREQGIDTSFFVWAHKSELMGRYIYEMGRTPRRSIAWYQRTYSAASRLGAGLVDWQAALRGVKLFHISGITLGLSTHSEYERNYNLEAFQEALAAKPVGCKIGMDFNYRGTLWSAEECRKVMTPVITDSIDWFITTLEDMASVYNMDCGKYGADEISRGDIGLFSDAELRTFAEKVQDKFQVEIVGITLRYPDSFEVHRWESIALDSQGNFFRSPKIRPMVLGDRIGGGDTWNSGFYYGLLTETDTRNGIQKGVLVGDAISRLKQTLMFDIGILTKQEVHALMEVEIVGGGRREIR